MNDAAVEDYLRQRGKYKVADTQRGKVHYASPPEEFMKLTWVHEAGMSYLRPFEEFMRQWRRLLSTLPADDIPEAKELAKIMMHKIVPKKLHRRVTDRCRSGRDPNRLNKVAAAWRRQARKDWRMLKTVIRENAEQMDIDRELPDESVTTKSSRRVTKVPLPGMATTASTGETHKPVCAAEGCNAFVRRRRDGRWFEYCYEHAHLWRRNDPNREQTNATSQTRMTWQDVYT